MENQQAGFVQLLMKTILPKVQLIALGISFLGLILYLTNNAGAANLLMSGLSTLAACYFLMGFSPPLTSPDSKPSLYSFVICKIVFIALSVTVIGILFALLKLEGGDQILLVGCSVLTIGLLSSAVMIITNHDNLVVLKNPLINGVAILMIGVYFLNKLSLIPF